MGKSDDNEQVVVIAVSDEHIRNSLSFRFKQEKHVLIEVNAPVVSAKEMNDLSLFLDHNDSLFHPEPPKSSKRINGNNPGP